MTRDSDTHGQKTCPFCAEPIRAAAVKCRYCGSRLDRSSSSWHRSPDERMLAGVCGGLAEHFGISVTAIRLAFVIASIMAFWGVVAYIVLLIIMPLRRDWAPPYEAGGRRARDGG